MQLIRYDSFLVYVVGIKNLSVVVALTTTNLSIVSSKKSYFPSSPSITNAFQRSLKMQYVD